MTSHKTPIDIERWHRAADKEGVSYTEFTRRALAERADRILDPLRGIISSFGKAAAGAIIRELDPPQGKICVCGHSETRHVSYGGNVRLGSCGSALCGCMCFREGPRAASPPLGEGREPEPKV